ncbi:MAG: hypothetical protein EPO22_10060 [Dehalococcoidia bacterium]|nr:MAG: hypothetical protein EPO22_10060 [Dehalococcoidia bacterium]
MLKQRIILPLLVVLAGAGLGLWSVATPAHGAVIAIQPLTITKIADGDHFVPTATVDYQIRITNPNDFTVSVDIITDTLPAGFSYNTGSSNGLASFDPDITGQTLSWFVDGEPVAGLSTATLNFSATISTDEPLGMYCNQATVDWGSGTASTGLTAPIQVLNEGDTQLTPTCGRGNVRTATPTVTATSPATATEVPATSTPVPPAPTATSPAGGSAGVISAPNTGNGPDAGSPSMLLLAVAGAMIVSGAGAAALGARRR